MTLPQQPTYYRATTRTPDGWCVSSTTYATIEEAQARAALMAHPVFITTVYPIDEETYAAGQWRIGTQTYTP